MAFPTTTVLDAFTRPDESPAADWGALETGGGVRVVSNQGKGVAGMSVARSNRYTPATYGPNVEAHYKVVTKSAGDAKYLGLVLRVAYTALDDWDGYRLLYRDSTQAWRISRLDNGSSTTLTEVIGGATLVNGDSIGGRIFGSDIELWHRSGGIWTLRASTSDSTYPAAGNIGVHIPEDTNTVIDDFSGGKAAALSPSFLGTSVLDEFNRADGALGANWAQAVSAYSLPTIVSNRMSWTAYPSAVWNPTTFAADQCAFAQVPYGSGGAILLLRWTNPNTGNEAGYLVSGNPVANQAAEAIKWTAGSASYVSLGYHPYVMDSNDEWIGASVEGSTIKLYGSADGETWNLRDTWTDGTITGTGKIGVYYPSNVAGTLDMFGGGALAGGGGGAARNSMLLGVG